MDSIDIFKETWAEWVPSIEQIDRKAWEQVFGSSIIKGYDFFYSIEKAKFPNVEYHYLRVFVDRDTKAIIPCFTYELDLLDLLTGKTLKKMVKSIRKFHPKFLKINTFVIGSYVATVEEFVGIRKDLEYVDHQQVCNVVHNQIKIRSERCKSTIVFVKDVRESNIEYLRKCLPHYCFYNSFPSNLIPVNETRWPYPLALKKKNRKRFRKYKELFDKDFSWEIVENFEEHTETFTQLYSNVLSVAKNKFETLNVEFFSNVNKYIPEKSFLLIARDQNKLVRVMELVIVEEDRLLPIYLGVNYMEDDTRILYLNTIFKTISLAEEMGKSIVDLGQTSYYPKVMSGAFVENLYYGFFSSLTIMNFLIKNTFKSIFPPVEVPDHVYLDDKKDEVITFLESKGVCLMNK